MPGILLASGSKKRTGGLPSGMTIWLKADAGTHKVAGGSDPCTTDNDDLLRWEDQSGNGNHFSQATSGKKFIYKTNIRNSLPAVRYNGSGSQLASSALTLNSSNTVYAVASRGTGAAGYRRLVAQENRFYVGTGPHGTATAFTGTGGGWGTVADTGAGWLSQACLALCSVTDGSTNTLYVNGATTTGRTNTFTAGSEVMTIGADPAATAQFWDGDIYEILVYPSAHDATQRAAVLDYLYARWSLTSANITVPSFTRYVSNPIVSLGSGGSWEDVDIANPDVFYDTPNSRWVMNYSGFDGTEWGTGLAYSTDLLSWTKEATNPVLTTTDAGTTYIAANGSIAYKGTTYYLFFQGNSSPSIFLATSSDLTTWSMANGGAAVISGAFDPFVLLDDDDTTFRLWYAVVSGGERRFVIATSTNGTSWTTVGNALVPHWGNAAANGFGEPSWDTYGTFYDYAPSSDSRKIYLAKNLDGLGGAAGGDIILQGSGSGWDSAQTFDSCVIRHSGTAYLFYAGATSNGLAENLTAQIGVATATI